MKLRRATPQETKYACERFHYAKAVPAKSYAYSVFNDDGEWCGVVVYSGGATPMIGRPYGLFQGEVLELVRVALNGKQGTTSKPVALSLKLLKHDAPKTRMVVSFADTEQGHLGKIYQAMNWKYVGVSEGGRYFVVNGKRTHPKTIHSRGWVQSEEWLKTHVDKNAKSVKGGDKHKYLYFFDKKLEKKMRSQFLPYPKALP